MDGKADLQLVKDMMTFDGNYKAYREHLASLDATEAVVPFIGTQSQIAHCLDFAYWPKHRSWVT